MRVIVLRKQELGADTEINLEQLPENVQEQVAGALEQRRNLLEDIGNINAEITQDIVNIDNTLAELSRTLAEGGELEIEDLERVKENLEEVRRALDAAAQAAENLRVTSKRLLKGGRSKEMRVITLRKQEVEEDPEMEELLDFLRWYERKLEELKQGLAESQRLSREIRESFERIGEMPVPPEEFVEEFKRVGREADKLLRQLRELGVLPQEEAENIRKADGTISIITDDDLDLQEEFKSVADKVYNLFPPQDEEEESNLKQAIEDLQQVLQRMVEKIAVIKVEGD
jgi:chromosome segregation ATPase